MKLAVALRMLALGALTLAPTGGHAVNNIAIEIEIHHDVDDAPSTLVQTTSLASFGPFRVVAPDRVELDGSIESETPSQFKAMLEQHPAIRQIVMVDCPGTGDDIANLLLARMIRKANITTYVPNGGSVRSGGVELFLAGSKRHADPGAEFAVHSWLDEDGMEPEDFAESDPVNQEYVAYYREMGMSADKARAFYALTNSVAHDEALYLKPRDIAAYIPLD
ncbi:MAG: alpha/beta hydrolase [Sphingorhabdus sp.]